MTSFGVIKHAGKLVSFGGGHFLLGMCFLDTVGDVVMVGTEQYVREND